ncbi:snaclec coagulation factor IX/factor X-binding protein subunit A-like [Branchiostoma floridae x Branchiostoma belcheri]
MVKPESILFGGKSLFEIYRQQFNLKEGDLEQDMVKMRLKVAQVYGLIGGGYLAWATALRIKGRKDDIPAVVQEGNTTLTNLKQGLKTYIDYGTCQSGYQPMNRKCYKAVTTWTTWAKAYENCQSEGVGGNLAMPKDSGTNNFLIKLKNAKSYYNQWGFWFGLKSKGGAEFPWPFGNGGKDEWKWIDGTSLGSFNYWAPNKPSPAKSIYRSPVLKYPKHCAEYKKRSDDKWNDIDCSNKRYFICERTPNGLY